MTNTITLYNNKGGVSKTTTLFNMGAYLAGRKNKKVLLIDADPQCNLTELFFAARSDYYDDPNIELPGDSILDVFRPRLEGAASRIDVKDINVAKSDVYQSLDLIRGDIEFSAMAETYFGSSINLAITPNINEKNTYLSFRRLVTDLGIEKKYDYILIDVGPSTGAITRLAFLASSKFLVPVTPDRFCYLGVRTLPKLIKSWLEHDAMIMATMKPYGINEEYLSPEFCGAINQNFQLHRNQIKESYSKWASLIKKEIRNKFLETNGFFVSMKLSKKDPFVCSIENIGQHAPVSQILGKAVFDLTKSDTAFASTNNTQFYGNVWTAWNKKTKNYEASIKKIVEAIE
ncbi:ParA family protein [Chromobacterium violaceum]|uniref:ParA family protein n=1 Tax=Chromobacterium violaceum TaxID=536 RepID=UPI0009BAD10B|nr:ParA family protein [Chromobacterium violaceum]